MLLFRKPLFLAAILLVGGSSSAPAQTKVACVGTSITLFSNYPAMLQDLLGSAYAVTNCGLSGATVVKTSDIPYWRSYIFPTVFSTKPAVITIELGTNDSKAANWQYSSRFVADLNALIDTFLTISPRPQIYLMLPPPAFPNTALVRPDTISKRIIPMITSVAQTRSIPLIDTYTPLASHPEWFPDGVHPESEGPAADTIAHILYRNIQGKPLILLSDSLVVASFAIGQARTPVVKTTRLVNQSVIWHGVAATVTKKAAWLTVTVNAANVDTQIITATVNAASIPDVEAQYYDTVNVHMNGAVPADLTFRVLAWIRPGDVYASVKITPDTAWMVTNTRRLFAAVALNQYGEPYATQPSFAWSATGGTIANGDYAAPAAAGNYQIFAAGNGKSDTAIAVVTRRPFLPDSGYITRLLVLENNTNGSMYLPIPTTMNGIVANGTDFLGNEATVQPVENTAATFQALACAWHVRQDSDGIWARDSVDNFVVYGAVYLYTPVARTAYIHYQCDNSLSLFLGQTRVVSTVVASDGKHEVVTPSPVAIAAGVTRVLIKLSEMLSKNLFAVRFTDAQGVNLRGINYLFTPDTGASLARSGIALPSQRTRVDARIRSRALAVRCDLPMGGMATIELINARGQTAGAWKSGMLGAGRHDLNFRITACQSGVYWARIAAPGMREVRLIIKP